MLIHVYSSYTIHAFGKNGQFDTEQREIVWYGLWRNVHYQCEAGFWYGFVCSSEWPFEHFSQAVMVLNFHGSHQTLFPMACQPRSTNAYLKERNMHSMQDIYTSYSNMIKINYNKLFLMLVHKKLVCTLWWW